MFSFTHLPLWQLRVVVCVIRELILTFVHCRFLTKLVTQDVPLLFVRPNKQIINYVEGKTAGPLSKDFKDGIMLKGFAGELSITLLEGRKLSYFPIGISKSCIQFLLCDAQELLL